MSRNEDLLERIRAGLVLACVGDAGPVVYKRSRRGDTPRSTARPATSWRTVTAGDEVIDFSPYGNDERQFCSPGFDLPVGAITRSGHDRSVRHHTSADDLASIDPGALADTLGTCLSILAVLEDDATLTSRNPKGEPQLGRRGLYRSFGGRAEQADLESALLWVMSMADGEHTTLDVAERSGLPFAVVHEAAVELQQVDLVQREESRRTRRSTDVMKVVLFCGGLGTRLREYTGEIPKPMVKIGYRPILWHLMKYYAHFGHTDFVLCLGYKADVVKEFFLHYEEWISNDFTLSKGGQRADAGEQRHRGLEHHLRRHRAPRQHRRAARRGEEVRRGRGDVPRQLLRRPHRSGPERDDRRSSGGATGSASFLAVPPSQSFHLVDLDAEGEVAALRPVNESDLLINAGFFAFRQEVFDYIEPGEELVLAAVRSPHRRTQAPSAIAMTASGAWTRSRSSSSSPTSTTRVGRPGRSGRTTPYGPPAPLMLPLMLRGRRARAATRCCASARTATTSRSGAAGR